MISLIVALIIIIGFFAYWKNYIYEEPLDIIFFILGLSYLASSAMFLDNVWLIRSRHMILPLFTGWTLCYFLNSFKKKEHRNNLSYNFIILFLWMLVASLWSEYPELAFQIKIKSVLYPIFFLIAGTYVSNYEKFKKLTITLFFPACFLVLVILFTNKSYNIDARLNIHDINPNGIAGYLGASIMIIFNMWHFSLKKYKPAILILIFVALGFLFMTGSRNGILSTLIGGTLVIIPYMKSFFSMIATVFTVGIGGVFFFLYFWERLPDPIKSRVFDLSNMSGRSSFWQIRFEELSESPWCGIGTIYYFGNVEEIMWGSMLNIYLNIYVELGIIGSVIAGIFLLQLLYYLFWCFKNIDHKVKYFIFAVIIFALTSGIGESMAMRGSHPITLIFLTFIGVLSNMKNNKDFFTTTCHLESNLSNNGANQ